MQCTKHMLASPAMPCTRTNLMPISKALGQAWDLYQALAQYLRKEESPRAVTSDIEIFLQLLLPTAASKAALCQVALHIVSEKDLA